jgi:hypothetical protein
MATEPGMFSGLNKYEAELMDAARQREASSADVGTGWQAMTQAAGRAGGMLGRTVGKALGGVTTAEQRVEDFQKIVASVPDFNPNNVESLQAMSSAMWQGGFYDQAKDMMDTSQTYQMMNAEAANVKARTDQIFNSMSLENQRIELEKSMNTGQLAQIDQLIADSKAGVLRDDYLSTLKGEFTRADILRIEEMITSSAATTAREDVKLGLLRESTDANIAQINSSIALNAQNIKASDTDIKVAEQSIQESIARVSDLSVTDLEKRFNFAVEKGYKGDFIDYQTLMANLKVVQDEGSISLYKYAKSKAGGSFEGTLEEFITSVTGVDYRQAVKEGDKYKTRFYDYTSKKQTALEDFLNKNIDMGGTLGLIADRFNVEGASVLKDAAGDYTVEQIGKHLFQMGLNAGVDPEQVWELYKGDIDFIMNQPIMKGALDEYKKWEEPKGGGADSDGTVDAASPINVSF